jgi:hypothetical protein
MKFQNYFFARPDKFISCPHSSLLARSTMMASNRASGSTVPFSLDSAKFLAVHPISLFQPCQPFLVSSDGMAVPRFSAARCRL